MISQDTENWKFKIRRFKILRLTNIVSSSIEDLQIHIIPVMMNNKKIL